MQSTRICLDLKKAMWYVSSVQSIRRINDIITEIPFNPTGR